MKRILAVFVLSFLFYTAHPAFCIGAITVINGDAETGDLAGWTASGAASAATNVRHSGGTATPGQGDWFFSFARPASSTGELEQAGEMEIGKGPVLRLSGIVQTESGFGDTAEAVISLLDADLAQVAQQTTGRMSSRRPWETFSVDVVVPPTATSWRINLLGNRGGVGQHLDSFVDDIRLGILGDFDLDGELTIDDLEALTLAIQSTDAGVPTSDLDRLQFDLDRSAAVERSDRRHWIKELRQTWIGDANLDGEFDSGDFVEVFNAGQYEDGIAENSTWGTGDWNGDREFDTGDLVFAFQDSGFEKGARQAVAAVPEPSTAVLLLTGLIGALRIRNRK